MTHAPALTERPDGIRVRVVAWNCYPGRLAEKLTHLSSFAPDVALLCEASRPGEPIPGVTWFGEKPRKGVAVVHGPRFDVKPLPVLETALWAIRPFRVDGPASFNLLTVWTHPRPQYLDSLSQALDVYGASLPIDRLCWPATSMQTPSGTSHGDASTSAAWPNASVRSLVS